MSKLLKNFVGFDMSKSFFDVVLLKIFSADNAVSSKLYHRQFKQTIAEYKMMILWLEEQGVYLDDETLFCMEDTGIYNYGLVKFLVANSAQLWVEMPLRIKKSDDFQRGSNDKTDAKKIAWYAYRYKDRMQLWQPLDSKLMKLKSLIAQRDRIVKSINRLEVPVNELVSCGCKEDANDLRKLQEPAVKQLKKTKEAIEAKIKELIKEEKQTSLKVKQVVSITGIGDVTAVALLIYTKGFTSFKNAKQLACYCGVVPFKKKDSGSSIKSVPKVSHYANKKLKWLMHMCAMSAIRWDQELRLFYEQKTAAGKNKMSVLNAVRNKLIHRVFAITRDNRAFVKDYVRKCA